LARCYDCGIKLEEDYRFVTGRNRCNECWEKKYGKVYKDKKEFILTRMFKGFFGLIINPWRKNKTKE